MTVRAAAYLRISKDDEGEALGTKRQYEAVKALCAAKGWELDPAWVIEENNRSAWDESKPRPGFQRLLRGMETGAVTAVAVYAFDRLARRRKDVTAVLECVEKHKVLVAAVTGGIDLSTPYGIGVAEIVGAIAGMEIRAMQERLRSKAEQNVRAGKVHNGGTRPYGFELDRLTVREPEAEVIREMAQHVIDGGSLSSLARSLNRRGIGTAGGKRWDTRKVRDVLDNPRLCGRVVHRGKVVPDVEGQWQKVLSPEEFDALQIGLAARRVVQERWTNERRHLLSGSMLRCGSCDGKIHAFQQTSGAWAYRCRGHLTRNEDHVNRHVREAVIAYALEHPVEVSAWDREETASIWAEIARLEQKKADTIRAFTDTDDSDPATLAIVTRNLTRQIDALKERQVEQAVLDAGIQWAQFDVTEVLARPAETPEEIEQQRATIGLYVSRIVLHPSKKRGRGYDDTATEIVFRDPNRLTWRGVVRTQK